MPHHVFPLWECLSVRSLDGLTASGGADTGNNKAVPRYINTPSSIWMTTTTKVPDDDDDDNDDG